MTQYKFIQLRHQEYYMSYIRLDWGLDVKFHYGLINLSEHFETLERNFDVFYANKNLGH